ncbi:EPIDERMAL PATTERNING FACTOR-like protein 4 [Benincasa hispida]|uniref:EPIDERMAL PATTERNING FACTOR-like protein 4 n=1 Tax=Benincasa hispida TaxID=102211 RepID=UPI0019011181|nr:EPIDERMAL PATTERNING FACTOR-like protein 4 [Benincasa hispida]
MGSPSNYYYHFSLLLILFLLTALFPRLVSASPESGGWIGDRKSLVGPGSCPPTCRAKCGRCRPCEPVHVPIQPGLSVPLEYYPEAWRCKCGNKLFMP